MDKKQAWTLFWATILMAAFFQFAFMYNMDPTNLKISHELNQERLPLFFIIFAVGFVPCLIIGYAGFNPLAGFISPALLGTVFWTLLIIQYKQSDLAYEILEKRLLLTASLLTLMSASFGVLVSSISGRIFKKFSPGQQNNHKKEPVQKTEIPPENLSKSTEEISMNTDNNEEMKAGKKQNGNQDGIDGIQGDN